MIYLCYPNNPTGTVLTRAQLKKWVDYALQTGALILYDAAYATFIRNEDVPHSIYEIEGAKECAVEFHSYSKTAGFTGLRCGFTIVPKEVTARGADGIRCGTAASARNSTARPTSYSARPRQSIQKKASAK